MKPSPYSLLPVALLIVLAIGGSAEAQHSDDVWIGRSSEATGGQLKVAADVGGLDPFDPLSSLVVLLPASGFFEGWSSDEPGFDAIQTDWPANDTYALAPGAEVWLDIVAIDPALIVIVPPDYEVLDTPGQSVYLGDYHVHKHMIWLIDSTSADFNPAQCIWRATFRLRDAGSTAYAPSAPFTIRFATASVNPADFDCDGDVDLADFGRFQSCFNGPNRPAKEPNCGEADLSLDGDVDLQDFGVFQDCFNGPNRPPACE